MRCIYVISLTLGFMLCSLSLSAQPKEEPGMQWPARLTDSLYKTPAPVELLPYPTINESGIKLRRRIWRRLDTRQKLNSYLHQPNQSLNQVIYDLALKGKVNAYKNDSFNKALTTIALKEIGKATIKAQVQNWRNPNDPSDLLDTMIVENFHWKKIVKYELLEEWYFDARAGEFIPRIIAIAPLMEVKGAKVSVDVPMFWIKMEELRPELVKRNALVANGQATTLTWDDAFNKYRLFDSYVSRETSSNNGYISGRPEYLQNGVATLLAAEEIKNDLFIFEHDLWEY